MPSSRRLLAAALTALACALAPSARADWVSFSGAENARNVAEVQVGDAEVRIALEVFLDDLGTFEPLVPDELLPDLAAERPPPAERLAAFSREGWTVVADGGEPLVAHLAAFEPRLRTPRPSPYAGRLNPFTGQVVPGPPEDRRVVYVELVYPFDGRPSTLTFTPPLDERGRGRLELGFVTYHGAVQLHDFRYLNGPVTLRLDWDDPWYSVYAERSLARWQRGSVMSYLYVEPYEVRHEILARVRDLEAWMDLGLRGTEFVEADENEPLKARIGAFLLERDRVTIDGRRSAPFLDRTAFVKLAPTGSAFLARPERLPIDTALVGVILTYPVEALPQEVRVEWTLWSDRVRSVPVDAIDPAGPFPSVVTPEDHVHVWTNYLTAWEPPVIAALPVEARRSTLHVPGLSAAALVGLVALAVVAVRGRRRWRGRRRGRPLAPPAAALVALAVVAWPYARVALPRPAALAPPPTDAEARGLLAGLLGNTYRSFDLRREEDVYDRLALSVHGDLLAEVYLQSRRSFVVAQAGGAQARVAEVEVLDVDVEPLAGLGLRYRARWTALGSVGHWGHVHTRKNLYEARITVEPVDGAYRITGLEMLAEARVDPAA